MRNVSSIQPVFGIPQLKITLELDHQGLIRCRVSKPVPGIQVIGLLIGALQGQYRATIEQASLLIDPNKNSIQEETPSHAGETQENDNGDGRSTG